MGAVACRGIVACSCCELVSLSSPHGIGGKGALFMGGCGGVYAPCDGGNGRRE